VEYVGEVIGQEEAERRLATQNGPNGNANEQQHNYLFTIREFIGGNTPTAAEAMVPSPISRAYKWGLWAIWHNKDFEQ
jgi:hypothetical protein